MKSNSVFKQSAWIYWIPQLIVMCLIILIWYQIRPSNAALFGSIIYFFIAISLKIVIPKSHRFGMRNIKTKKFKDAIAYFEKSIVFFDKYDWLDKYRFIFLLSASKMAYREMAYCNIAYCYVQLNKLKGALKFYEKALNEFPHSKLALEGIEALKQAKNKDQSSSQ